jgi:hypothetical protein
MMKWYFEMEYLYPFLRTMRCWIVQGMGRALLWMALLGAAGYAAYKTTTPCPDGQTCFSERKLK